MERQATKVVKAAEAEVAVVAEVAVAEAKETELVAAETTT
jgi:hypothetical protein|tara:strand:+ start:169 stop:288 length:120 start_codon:yes stop_codon:yes gene_type:complete